MAKIVYNARYGGFGLSKAAFQRYFDLKRQKVWIEENKYGIDSFTVWLVPPEERIKEIETEEWVNFTIDQRIEYNSIYNQQIFNENDLDRTDPILVQVVEMLGDKANGKYADLKIRELPKGTKYRIHEYDGNESVVSIDEYDWQEA